MKGKNNNKLMIHYVKMGVGFACGISANPAKAMGFEKLSQKSDHFFS